MSNILQAAPYTANVVLEKPCFNTEVYKQGCAIRVSCDRTEEEYTMLITDSNLSYIQGYRIAPVTLSPVLVEIEIEDYLKGVVTIKLLEEQREVRIWQM